MRVASLGKSRANLLFNKKQAMACLHACTTLPPSGGSLSKAFISAVSGMVAWATKDKKSWIALKSFSSAIPAKKSVMFSLLHAKCTSASLNWLSSVAEKVWEKACRRGASHADLRAANQS